MSLDVRFVTNGEKNGFYVRDEIIGIRTIYDTIDDVPQSIRHYALQIGSKPPQFLGPNLAAILGVQDILYPDFPCCNHPKFYGKRCVAESCKYGDETDRQNGYKKCPYFGIAGERAEAALKKMEGEK